MGMLGSGPFRVLIGALMGITVLMLGLEIMRGPFTAIVTDPATQATSVTSDAGGLGSMLLTSEHFFSDTEDLTATGATDGNVTATTTVAADRRTLNFTGLTASTAQVITVNYLEDSGGIANGLWKAVPFFIMVGVVGGALFGTFSAGRGMAGGGIGAKVMAGVLVAVIGVIMAQVGNDFIAQAEAAFSNAPEFVGVTISLPLVELSFLFMIIALVFGMISQSGFVSRARSNMGF